MLQVKRTQKVDLGDDRRDKFILECSRMSSWRSDLHSEHICGFCCIWGSSGAAAETQPSVIVVGNSFKPRRLGILHYNPLLNNTELHIVSLTFVRLSSVPPSCLCRIKGPVAGRMILATWWRRREEKKKKSTTRESRGILETRSVLSNSAARKSVETATWSNYS